MNQNTKNTGLFQLSAIALDNGFILWDQSNDWIMETTVYKCLLGPACRGSHHSGQ